MAGSLYGTRPSAAAQEARRDNRAILQNSEGNDCSLEFNIEPCSPSEYEG